MKASELVLSAYRTIRSLNDESLGEIGLRVPIPKFDKSVIKNLVDDAISTLKFQSPLIQVKPPVFCVGDLHGSLIDLVRIIKHISSQPTQKIIFLGDYVDRGPFSTEVITFLTALFCTYPETITLLRGNHEFQEITANYGFKKEVSDVYGELSIWNEYSRLFSYLPIAAVVNDLLCVHGGISPELTNLTMIKNLKKPALNEKDYPNFVNHLLWADPSNEFSAFSESGRGKGITFGCSAMSQFSAYTGIKKIIRAHQCVNGIKESLNGACITVFSSSNYKKKKNNSSGILHITTSMETLPIIFEPLEKHERNEYAFFDFSEEIAIRLPLSLQTSPSNFIGNSKNKCQSFLTAPNKSQKNAKKDSKKKRTEMIKKLIVPQEKQ